MSYGSLALKGPFHMTSNRAGLSGGALHGFTVSLSCQRTDETVMIPGTNETVPCLFFNNSVDNGDGGALYLGDFISNQLDIHGDVMFANNSGRPPHTPPHAHHSDPANGSRTMFLFLPTPPFPSYSAGRNGGAIFSPGAPISQTQGSHLVFVHNRAGTNPANGGSGGALYYQVDTLWSKYYQILDSVVMRLSNISFDGNSCTSQGGAVFIDVPFGTPKADMLTCESCAQEESFGSEWTSSGIPECK